MGTAMWVSYGFYSLSHVLGGEGGGEGQGARADERRSNHESRSPLSPTLSPDYRGEGVNAITPAVAVGRARVGRGWGASGPCPPAPPWPGSARAARRPAGRAGWRA